MKCLKVVGAPNKPNGRVINWCNPNGIVKPVFPWDNSDKGSANTLLLNPVSNKSKPNLTDQEACQLVALETCPISTELNKLGITEESHSNWTSLIVLVPKTDGSVRSVSIKEG